MPSLGAQGNNQLEWAPGHTEAHDLEAQTSLGSGLDFDLGLEADLGVALGLVEQQSGLVVVAAAAAAGTFETSGHAHGLVPVLVR